MTHYRPRRSKWSVVFRDSRQKIIWITDDDGSISITNDAEHVVRELHRQYPHYRVVYRDTEGRWDELLHTAGDFTGFKMGGPKPPE